MEMSWLARSLANSLRLDDDRDGEGEDDGDDTTIPETREEKNTEEPELDQHGRGVKEDLTEFKQTLTRQLWGVASFLAPPPAQSSAPFNPHDVESISDLEQCEPSDQSVSGEISDEETFDSVGIRDDIAEIGGRFRPEISNPSNNRAVSEISEMDSNFLPFRSDGRDSVEEYDFEGIPGITEEVLAFARNIAHHPETWLDFPLEEEDDLDDFDMSDAQEDHALAIEHLAPRLAALRIELCPSHMSKGYFWKIYFVLLHSRLNRQDAELLSTPQIVAARAMWMQELQKKTKPEPDWSGRSTYYSKDSTSLHQEDSASTNNSHSENMPFRTFALEPVSFPVTTDLETEKYTLANSESQISDKSVIEEKPEVRTKDFLPGPSSKVLIQNYEDDEDDWPEDEILESGAYSRTIIPVGHEEDVSFSDLEDDDCIIPIKSK